MIKKMSIVAICALFFTLAACKIGSSVDQNDIITNFTAKMSVNIDDKQYDCDISRTDGNITKIIITSPDTVSGLTYEYRGEGYTISYNDKVAEGDYPYLPDSSFSEILTDILSSVSSGNSLGKSYSVSGSSCFDGECESGDFKVTVSNDTGFIQKIEAKDYKIEYTFSDMEAGD